MVLWEGMGGSGRLSVTRWQALGGSLWLSRELWEAMGCSLWLSVKLWGTLCGSLWLSGRLLDGADGLLRFTQNDQNSDTILVALGRTPQVLTVFGAKKQAGHFSAFQARASELESHQHNRVPIWRPILWLQIFRKTTGKNHKVTQNNFGASDLSNSFRHRDLLKSLFCSDHG